MTSRGKLPEFRGVRSAKYKAIQCTLIWVNSHLIPFLPPLPKLKGKRGRWGGPEDTERHQRGGASTFLLQNSKTWRPFSPEKMLLGYTSIWTLNFLNSLSSIPCSLPRPQPSADYLMIITKKFWELLKTSANSTTFPKLQFWTKAPQFCVNLKDSQTLEEVQQRASLEWVGLTRWIQC